MSFKLVGIGELLWDLLPDGKKLGGAPGNFVYHARALGAEARLISRVGTDEPGREALDQLARLGIPTDSIEVDENLPTGTVSVSLASDGQPQYVIHENVAWDHLRGGSASEVIVSEADAVCFGSLAQRCEVSRETIRRLVAAAPARSRRILDVNLRQHFYSREIIESSLTLANVLKVNDAELPRLADMFGIGGDAHAQMSGFAARFGLRVVACTRGAHGSLLLADGRWSEHPGVPTQVADTVGAGDAFTAALTLGLLAEWDLDLVQQRANQIAAFVASRAGATPELPRELRAPFLEIRAKPAARAHAAGI